jgi:RimJ/RimL family protein N-acetyltransferase
MVWQKYQRTYVNKNCKYLLLEFAFEKLGMERVGFRANSLNKQSISAMKSIGCTEEGVLRNFYRCTR